MTEHRSAKWNKIVPLVSASIERAQEECAATINRDEFYTAMLSYVGSRLGKTACSFDDLQEGMSRAFQLIAAEGLHVLKQKGLQ